MLKKRIRHCWLLVWAVCLIPAITNKLAAQPLVKEGIADLRDITFDDKPVALDGNWFFAWNELLTPAQAQQANILAPFPALWNGAVINGKALLAKGCATYTCTILLPKNHPKLALNMPMLYSAYSIYINGQLAASNGVPATSAERYIPAWEPVTVVLPAQADTIRLLMQVANWSHTKGGCNSSITIQQKSVAFFERVRNITTDFFLCGCLFMGGLFFLALYYFGTRDRATFFFSIFCILYSYRLVGTSYYSLHTVFPDLNWFVTTRIEYISLFGGVYLFFKYVKNLYPNDVHKSVLYIVTITCIGLCVITLLSPVYFFTKLLTPFLLLIFLYILYVIAVLIKAYRNKRPAAGFALISVAVLMVMQLMVELDYFGIINSSRWALFGGHIIFFFLQSLILSFRFSFRLKLAKKQAERGLKAKSDFLSTMSHEIRTPLNSVIGMSNLMLQNSPRPDQKEQLDVLQFSANSLLCIVNDILDYNKIEAGKISFEQVEMDIKGIIIKILSGLRMQAKEKGIYLQYEGDEALDCQVMGDPTRFAQVVQNLVGNAVKFTTQGGVTVTVGVVAKGQSTVTVKVSVIDTGIGIAKQNQQLIFERFTQEDSTTSRKYGGTGLGLAICKKILLLQNSDLLIKSEPGKGATFYFTQVFKKGKALAIANESVPVAEPAKQKPLLGTLILLVEDNNVNIMVARNFLEGWGAGIEVAHNGQEAIDMLDVSRHQLVLMDLHMPVMDGYTAIRKIREQGIGIPIIALTASLPSEVDAEMKGLAINGYVLKPFVPEDLLKKVMSHTVSAET